MKPKPGMISRKQDSGACWEQWYRTRKAHLLALSGEPPSTLCVDQLNLTVCCRYADSLMKSVRISRYLAKYHPKALRELQLIVEEFESMSELKTHGAK
jgi:hypothetical protein